MRKSIDWQNLILDGKEQPDFELQEQYAFHECGQASRQMREDSQAYRLRPRMDGDLLDEME